MRLPEGIMYRRFDIQRTDSLFAKVALKLMLNIYFYS